MSLSPRQYAARIIELRARLAAEAPRIAQAMALEGKDVVQQRIQEREGITGREYRTVTLRRKTAKGHRIDIITLTDTGRMWASLIVGTPVREGSAYLCGFTSLDSTTAGKVKSNVARYGQFLAPLPDEVERIRMAGADQINALMKQYL